MSYICRLAYTLVEIIETHVFRMCIGIAKRTMTNIWQEASCGSAVFSSPAKQYKVSRQCVLVDTFDCEAIRRKIYQLYEVKEHVTAKKLLVTRLHVTDVIL